jgi:hypothetical protein
LKESATILNAYYLPATGLDPDGALGAGSIDVPAGISPVNSFRLIFDTYFGTDLGLLDDRFFFAHRSGMWNFIDVTDAAETCSTEL